MADMKKRLGLGLLIIINSFVLFFLYWCIYIVCSTKVDNVLNIPYEPSGMQLYFYVISFPLVLLLTFLSIMHSYYFNLQKSLSLGLIIIWLSYLSLILFVDFILHFSITGKNFFYYGSLFISFLGICYVIHSTYDQVKQLMK